MKELQTAWAVARHDLALHLARPTGLIVRVGAPILFLIMFSLFVISGGGAPVAVHQGDTGRFGSEFVSVLQNSGLFRVESAGSKSAALAAIHDQKAVAAVEMPPWFSNAISADKPVPLPMTLDNQNNDIAADVRDGLPLVILEFYRKSLPARLPLSWREIDTYSSTIGLLPYIAVSLFSVAFLYGGLFIGSTGMVREWARGTMKAVRLAPVSGWIVVAGKLASSFILGLGSALLVLGLMWLIGVRPQTWGPVIAVVPLVLLVFTSLGVAAGTLLRSHHKTQLLVHGLGLPMFFLSGIFGPISWGAQTTAMISRVFPVVYANAALQHAIFGFWVMNVAPGVLWAVLGGWALAAVLASIWAYQRATTPRGN